MTTDLNRATMGLPVDVLTLCFDLLPIRGIFTVLPLVCKQWRNVLVPIQRVRAMIVLRADSFRSALRLATAYLRAHLDLCRSQSIGL